MSGLIDRAEGCPVGGLIGDAMGTPSEGLEPAEIERRFGWIEDFSGDGTDDSIMKYLLADALIAGDGDADADGWAAQWLRQPDSIGGDKIERFFASVLHCAAKLRYGVLPRRVALGNMPSSSSAMSIAPVGIVNAGHPRAAAAQAQEIASLIHIDEVAFCQDGAVAVAAAIATALAPGATLDDVLAAATAHIKPWSGAEMIALIGQALALAQDAADYVAFRATYHDRFRRAIACDSRETVPATLALVRLANGDPRRTLCYAAISGGTPIPSPAWPARSPARWPGSAAFPPSGWRPWRARRRAISERSPPRWSAWHGARRRGKSPRGGPWWTRLSSKPTRSPRRRAPPGEAAAGPCRGRRSATARPGSPRPWRRAG